MALPPNARRRKSIFRPGQTGPRRESPVETSTVDRRPSLTPSTGLGRKPRDRVRRPEPPQRRPVEASASAGAQLWKESEERLWDGLPFRTALRAQTRCRVRIEIVPSDL